MKIYLAQIARTAQDPAFGRHIVREYLQARILASMQRAGAMIPLAFHGGTALRFLYQIPRYSEDLDFALERATADYDLRRYLKAVRSDLLAEAYPVEVKINERNVVQSALVRFRGLLYELGLTPHSDEVLSIKIEVDTHPPAGAGLTTAIVRRYELLQLQHHDKASMLAGKLHAILQKPYAKGRDVYDLFWYLSGDWPPPNLTLLNNALVQTGWRGEPIATENWRAHVLDAGRQMDWQAVVRDVQPFLMAPGEAGLLTAENLARLLNG